jgi:hypothetical protein
MKRLKDQISHVKKARLGKPALGLLAGFARCFLIFLVIFVSAQSSSASRIRLDGPSSSTPSLEKRHPFIPPITHNLKTSFVSADERNDSSWFAAVQVRGTVWLVDRVAVGKSFQLFDEEDPPGSVLVLPLRI